MPVQHTHTATWCKVEHFDLAPKRLACACLFRPWAPTNQRACPLFYECQTICFFFFIPVYAVLCLSLSLSVSFPVVHPAAAFSDWLKRTYLIMFVGFSFYFSSVRPVHIRQSSTFRVIQKRFLFCFSLCAVLQSDCRKEQHWYLLSAKFSNSTPSICKCNSKMSYVECMSPHSLQLVMIAISLTPHRHTISCYTLFMCAYFHHRRHDKKYTTTRTK